MKRDLLKTKNTQLSRFLWVAKQAENPPKAESYLGVVGPFGITKRCCLGNACSVLLHESARATGTLGTNMEEWLDESVELPGEVAEVLDITSSGLFNNVPAVNSWIKKQFGPEVYDKNEEFTSLVTVNDDSNLDHEQIGILIQACFENEWFIHYQNSQDLGDDE